MLQQKIKEQAQLINSYKGKYYKMKNTELIDESTAETIANVEQPSEAVPALLNAAAPNLPGILGSLAKNPQIQGYLKKLAEDHPDEAAQFLGKYIPKITQLGSSQNQNQQGRL